MLYLLGIACKCKYFFVDVMANMRIWMKADFLYCLHTSFPMSKVKMPSYIPAPFRTFKRLLLRDFCSFSSWAINSAVKEQERRFHVQRRSDKTPNLIKKKIIKNKLGLESHSFPWHESNYDRNKTIREYLFLDLSIYNVPPN